MPRTTVAPSDPDPARRTRRTRRSTDAPAPGAAERPPTATIRDPIGTAELKRIQKDAERLQRATEGARAAVEKEASARTQAAETGQIMRLELAGQPSSPQEFTELVTAGRELHASLQALLHNKPLWRRLAHAEAALPKPAELLPIQEVLDHDLRMLLRLLGYRRPPPEVEVAERLHEALGRMMEPAASSDLRGPRTALAEDELTLFVWRLERTLDQAEGAAPPPPAPSVRIRTAIWVRRAVEVAVPAFLSAGTVAAATSGEKEALAVGVVAGGWEVVKKFIEVGSADVLAQTLGTGALPQPDDTAKQLADHIDKRMAAVEAAAGRPPGDQEREKAVFLARRALHRALQHAAVDDRPEAQDQQPRRWEELLVLLREQDLGRAVTACRAGQDATGG